MRRKDRALDFKKKIHQSDSDAHSWLRISAAGKGQTGKFRKQKA